MKRISGCLASPALWEIVIRRGLRPKDFQVDPPLLRRGLLDNGYNELPIVTAHVVAIASLPAIHKDALDRLLVAQCDGGRDKAADHRPEVAESPGPIREIEEPFTVSSRNRSSEIWPYILH